MIEKSELLRGRDESHASEYTPEISDNLDRFLKAINVVRILYSAPMEVASGWRPPSLNKNVKGAAKRSNHMMGLAIDFMDLDGKLRDWVLSHLPLMQELGFFFEDFRWTPTWVHFQIVPPASGRRIFLPYADVKKNPMTKPDAWSGIYDGQYDQTKKA
ncbi:MAG: DUF882 domain-containing protein [Alphaproteobacteria bacterium]|nr:MAG: DUF882 domain-containing protein [Alphaproteobacteria bacterium]